MDTVFVIFIVLFLSLSVFGVVISIVRGRDTDFAKNCRKSSLFAFIISMLLLFLRFVMT